MVHKLEAAPVTITAGTPAGYLRVRDRAMHSLGRRGKRSSGVSALWDEMLNINLAEHVTELALPAYFFHGVHDYTVSCQLPENYVEKLKAPLKGFYTFDRSAHSPVMEEPQKAQRIMREDVLAGTNSLADGSHR